MPPPSDDLDALIVGAGFSGLYLLYRLRDQGFRAALVDAAAGPGGVWHNNHYPGARVDSHIPNYEYSIEAVWRDWVWEERYPGWAELRRYFEHVIDVLDLAPHITYETRVTAARFDESDDRWDVESTAGPYRPRHLLLCTGFASKPYVPDLPGLDRFTGEWHHTAVWPETEVPLAGRRVGVFGTGASGVQVVQEAGPVAEHLTVFQRSPVMALPMRQWKVDPERLAQDKLDYPETFRRRNAPPNSFHDLIRLDMSARDVGDEKRQQVYEDAWEVGGFQFWSGTFNDTLADEVSNRYAYDFWRDKIHERVHDPAVARILAPDEPPYPFGTKRPSLEQNFYDVFNQDNVTLVDLKADPLVEITETGVRTEGGHHELDLLVLATGFDANTGGLTQIDLRDTSGRTMDDRWADGVEAHIGMAVHGFPNLLFLYGPLSPTAFCNGPTCSEIQGDWVTACLDHMRAEGLTRLESTADADRAWREHVDAFGERTLFPRADSWYMAANIPGKKRQLLNLPSSDDYLAELAKCEAAGYVGFEFS